MCCVAPTRKYASRNFGFTRIFEVKKLTFEEIEQMPAEQLYALSDEYLEFLERYGVGYSAVIDGDI